MISIDDFKKVELKVGRVLAAERVEGSDKLLKLKISLGDEERQLVAGIGKRYEPTDIVGKEIVVVANLEYRQLMGLESQGMLLAANDDGPVFISPEKDVSPGAKIS